MLPSFNHICIAHLMYLDLRKCQLFKISYPSPLNHSKSAALVASLHNQPRASKPPDPHRCPLDLPQPPSHHPDPSPWRPMLRNGPGYSQEQQEFSSRNCTPTAMVGIPLEYNRINLICLWITSMIHLLHVILG